MRTLRPLLATALALLALPAAGAQAAAPGLNLGTTADGIVRPSHVDEAAATGAKSIRLFVEWSQIERDADDVYVDDRVQVLVSSVRRARELGMTPVLAVFQTPRWANGGQPPNHPPADNGEYAEFINFLANQLRGLQPVLEIWSEQDAEHFWHGAPQPERYADMLQRSRYATQGTDATILFGALTGNNYKFFEQAYDRGRLTPASFDGVAVHTDTACASNPPSFYVRNADDRRINQYSFLGFREVRDSMLRRGLTSQGIWMTELGWSTYQGPCEREAGRAGGVTEAQQAAFLRQAFECLANYDYVHHAQVFDFHDRGTDREGMFGISGKPAFSVFQQIAAAPPAPGVECGDFTPPTVVEQLPSKLFNGPLVLRATATDASGLTRFTIEVDGKDVLTYAPNGGKLNERWFFAKDLSLGKHRLVIKAHDPLGNIGATDPIEIEKIDPERFGRKLPAKAEFAKAKVDPKTKIATIGATVEKSDALTLTGKIRAIFEVKRRAKPVLRGASVAAKKKAKRWKVVHRPARYVRIDGEETSATVTIRQRLTYKNYRMRLVYESEAPHKGFRTKYRKLRRP